MTLTKIQDHDQRAVDDLIGFFRRERIETITRVFAEKAQEIEDVFWQLITERFLDTAVGVNLDILGRIVRRERGPLNDDVYRAILRGKIAANLSSGTYPEVLRVVELCLNVRSTGISIEVVPEYPAAATLRVDLHPIIPGLGPYIADLITSAASNGVRVLFQYHEVGPSFAFDGQGGATMDSSYYFSTTAEGRE